jgi:hypothetical protein
MSKQKRHPRGQDEFEVHKMHKSNERPFESPLKKHYCTDIICLGLLWVFLIALALLSVVAYMNGNPTDLVLPHDSKGNFFCTPKSV